MDIKFTINSLWVFIASVLVFIMHAGFATVEVGFTQAKNAVNIFMKNFVTVAAGMLCFFFLGYGLMYGKSFNGFIGTDLFALVGKPDSIAGISFESYFFFQAIFCATAATIVSGAMAERVKFWSYILFCLIITTFIYPLTGHWIWGGGFLSRWGFMDFAGGMAVHGVGGSAALVGAYMVGARKGKYKEKSINAIPGHNIPLAGLGVLLLWFGWFGFNPGSTLDITSPVTFHAAITTFLAASASTMAAVIFSSIKYGKPDAGLTLNGALAGLVAVTPGAAYVDYGGAMIIGVLASIIMIYAVAYIDVKLKIDDPVGAITVHGICGSLGTILVGLFSTEKGLFYGGGLKQLGIQTAGVAICAAAVILLSFAAFSIIKAFVGLRIEEDMEYTGIDVSEHGISAYIKLY